MAEKVIRVDEVVARVEVMKPPHGDRLVVLAHGEVSSQGWSDAYLAERAPSPGGDGTYEFDFVATPPTGTVMQVVTPITGVSIVTHLRPNAKMVRVYARENSKEQVVH